MGMPAKKKSPVVDDRKPRINTFAAFICAQPFDIPAREITHAGQTAGYDVVSVSTVVATRSRYEHLRFVAGDPPTAYVMEFLSTARAKAKLFTASHHSAFGLKCVTSPPPAVSSVRPLTNGAISAIVESVLNETDNAALKKAIPSEAMWGRRANGEARKKSGQKPGNLREKLSAKARQILLDEAPAPAAPPSPPVVVEPVAAPESETAPPPRLLEPAVEPAPAVVVALSEHSVPEQEDDDVLLQRLRDSFEVGDIVHVTQPTLRGNAFTREGRIECKEAKFATVLLGTTTSKIPYKRLKLAPRTTRANNTNNQPDSSGHVLMDSSVPPAPAPARPAAASAVKANSNGIPEGLLTPGPLKEVPPAFMQLKAVVVPASAPEIPAPTEKLGPKPKVAAAAPTPTVVKTTPPSVVTSEPAATLTQEQKDLRAWIEMGAAFGGDLVAATEAALRTEAIQLEQEMNRLKDELAQKINRLTAERDSKLKQAETLATYIRVTQVGGKK